MVRRVSLFAFVMGFVAGCGGSASESPWPREPAERGLDPAGEKAPDEAGTIDVTKLPDRYSERNRDEAAGGAAAGDDGDDVVAP
ncbi:MAG: hypothetical protein AAF928_14665 [Myxococcota bacterium]